MSVLALIGRCAARCGGGREVRNRRPGDQRVDVAAKRKQRGERGRLDAIGALPALRGGHIRSAVALINERKTGRGGAGKGWSGVERELINLERELFLQPPTGH